MSLSVLSSTSPALTKPAAISIADNTINLNFKTYSLLIPPAVFDVNRPAGNQIIGAPGGAPAVYSVTTVKTADGADNTPAAFLNATRKL